MQWNHLPVSGGIYDQHPRFLDDILVIANEESTAKKEDQRKQEAKMKSRKSRR